MNWLLTQVGAQVVNLFQLFYRQLSSLCQMLKSNTRVVDEIELSAHRGFCRYQMFGFETFDVRPQILCALKPQLKRDLLLRRIIEGDQRARIASATCLCRGTFRDI